MTQFKYVPAGLTYRHEGALDIYVRYERHNGFRLVSYSSHHVRIKTPDRELLILSNANQAQAIHPTSGTFDECISTSLFNDLTAQDLDVEYCMVNYTEESQGDRGSRHRPFSLDNQYKTNIIADSGGFQMHGGKLDFIDPLEVVKWYNRNVDLGMVLDIPYYSMGDPVQFAKIQKKNTKILLDNKIPSLELINIIHGGSSDMFKRVRDIVETPEIDRLAIGGFPPSYAMCGLERVLSGITQGQPYKHCHILGVSNMLTSLLLMKAASMDFIPLMTLDSTTSTQMAFTKQYMSYRSLGDSIKYLQVGNKSNFSRVSTDKTLPCQCPVCTAVKYTDIFNVIDNFPIRVLLTYHNIFTMSAYMRNMYAVVREISDKELKKYIRTHFKNSADVLDQAVRSVDYIRDVKELGVDAARVKNKFYLTYPSDTPPEKKPLFSPELYQEYAPEDAPNEELGTTELTERGNQIVERYIQYHDGLEKTEQTQKLPNEETNEDSRTT